MHTNRIMLVLGATGGVGGEVAREALRRGWNVRALNRHPERMAAERSGIEWVGGDAMNQADVMRAAEGVHVIVHAVNPPAYRHWEQWVMPMMVNTIAAARHHGARIVLPGTVYNYGPDAFPVIAEDAPQQPKTRKGAIRVKMEQALRDASREGVPVLIVRAGDFFGPQAGNSWFAHMVTAGKPVKRVMRVGKAGVGHTWSYLPDVAQTMLRLLDKQEKLGVFENLHMAGHWDADGWQMARSVARVAGGNVSIYAFPWWAVTLARPFVKLMRELHEMRYLWMRPVRMDNRRLRELLGEEPHTPLDEAVRHSLRGMRCLAET
ncbi:NAD-dependent epimerase/dehydratase family protein [Dyella sp.]|uniref:NAD-dependent epimerase/dehydratase family protein n=1 Tax=Dyella sp. TaxID=1869338 RepID=UPI002ED1801D